MGRDGGDEFLMILRGMDHAAVRHCLQQIRQHILDYSAHHPEMPMSYAVGYGLSTDLEGPTMRELFREADKNMYIDKNRAKMEEADVQHRTNLAMLNFVKKQGYHFSSCMYCDAQQDRYRTLRAGLRLFWRRMETTPALPSRSPGSCARQASGMPCATRCSWPTCSRC